MVGGRSKARRAQRTPALRVRCRLSFSMQYPQRSSCKCFAFQRAHRSLCTCVTPVGRDSSLFAEMFRKTALRQRRLASSANSPQRARAVGTPTPSVARMITACSTLATFGIEPILAWKEGFVSIKEANKFQPRMSSKRSLPKILDPTGSY